MIYHDDCVNLIIVYTWQHLSIHREVYLGLIISSPSLDSPVDLGSIISVNVSSTIRREIVTTKELLELFAKVILV